MGEKKVQSTGSKKRTNPLVVLFGIVDVAALALLCVFLITVFTANKVTATKQDTAAQNEVSDDSEQTEEDYNSISVADISISRTIDKEIEDQAIRDWYINWYGEDYYEEYYKDGDDQDSDNTYIQAAADDGEYVIPYSDQVYLTEDDLTDLSKEELVIARNEIYARHGRTFKSEELQAYFDQQDWYEGEYDPDEFDAESEDILNDYERTNAEFIHAYEEDMGY